MYFSPRRIRFDRQSAGDIHFIRDLLQSIAERVPFYCPAQGRFHGFEYLSNLYAIDYLLTGL